MTSRWILLTVCLVACGEARGTSGFDTDTGAPTVDAGNPDLDAGNPLPPRDAGNPDLDAGSPLPPRDAGNPDLDAGNPLPPRDAGNPVLDTGNPLPPRDAGNGGVCPPSCQTTADCNPCRGSGDPVGSSYCCISGLCLFMSGVCPAPTTDAGNPMLTDVNLNFGDLGDSGF